MKIAYQAPGVKVIQGDCLEVLRKLPEASIDVIITDPPYGLSNTSPKQVTETIMKWASGEREFTPTGKGFMGKSWDAFVPPPAVWDEAFRVLKPGGHLLSFAGTRTMGLMDLSIRLAGFEIRDALAWMYGTGMPKGQNISKAMEAKAKTGKTNSRALRETEQAGDGESYSIKGKNNGVFGEERVYDRKKFEPSTEDAQEWHDWYTQLKPAFEPIVLAQKPFKGSIVDNILEHGTGALNIGATRIGFASEADEAESKNKNRHADFGSPQGTNNVYGDYSKQVAKNYDPVGRFPTNVILDPEQAEVLDDQSGITKSSGGSGDKSRGALGKNMYGTYEDKGQELANAGGLGDVGGASRFFFVAEPDEQPGRYPANVILDEDQAEQLDEQSGVTQSRKGKPRASAQPGEGWGMTHTGAEYNDIGGASRFFYVAKANRAERPVVDGVQHVTVKPLTLMRYLIKLATPPGGIVLDPFAGSGTTVEAAILEGVKVVGVELDETHIPLIEHRIERSLPKEEEVA